jgi:hypothetical protein
VATFGVDVKLGGNLELLEGLEVDKDILFVDRIVFGLKQKGGRGTGARFNAARKLRVRGRFDEIAGIDGDDEVGTCADGGSACRLIGALEIRMVAEDDDKVGSGRKSQNSDAIWFEMPLRRVGTCDAHGLLGVFEVRGIVRETLFHGNAVFDESTVDSDGVEPGADFGAFEIVRQDAVPSAGKDDDGGPGVVGRRRRVKAQRRLADIREVRERSALNKAIGRFGDVGFRRALVRLGGSTGPKWKCGLLGMSERYEESECGEEKMKFHDNIVLPSASCECVFERRAGSSTEERVDRLVGDDYLAMAAVGWGGVFWEFG